MPCSRGRGWILGPAAAGQPSILPVVGVDLNHKGRTGPRFTSGTLGADGPRMAMAVRSWVHRVLRAWAWGCAFAAVLQAQAPFISPASRAEFMPRLSGLRNGIPQQVVYCLVRDARGRIWAGTRTGPYVYNGRRWTPVTLPARASSRQIRAILEDHEGRLWFGSQEGGIWRLDHGEWTFFDTTSGLPANRINTLVEVQRGDGRHEVWAGTTDGIGVWTGSAWTVQARDLGLPHPWVWRFRWLKGPSGPDLWATTQKGIARWDGARWTQPVPQPPVLETNDLAQEEDSGALWASLWGRGVARWDGRAWSFPQGSAPFPGTRPTVLQCGRNEQGQFILWAGTYDRGLASFYKGEWRQLSVEQGLTTSGVLSLLHDEGGGRPFLWIGSRGAGIPTLGLDGVGRVLGHTLGEPLEEVRAVQDGPDGRGREVLWFGTRNGALHWNGGRWVQVAKGLPAREIFCLARDPQGTLWAGTARGVAFLPAGQAAFHPLPGLADRIHALAVEQGEVWAGTEKGLFRWDGRAWTLDPAGPGPIPIYAIAFTQGPGLGRSLWAATSRHGLWERREGRWTRHDPNPNFPNTEISCLLPAPGPGGESWLWVGLQGNGLARMDLEHREQGWRTFSTRSSKVPLPENIVRAIARDRQGAIYIAQSMGICRFTLDPSGKEILEVDAYWSPDGLPSRPAHFCSGFTDREGKVWFGFPDEAAYLDPGNQKLPATPPAPALESCLIQGKPFPFKGGTVLTHRQNRVVLEYFIPAFLQEEEIQFQSQLLGAEEPSPWGMENRREFTDLAAGDYTFKVWARDAKGRVGPPLELPFRVKPAPWRHPLAYAAYLLLAGAAIVQLVRLRTRLLQERNRRLEEAVTRATADLRGANARLEQLSEEKSQFMGIAAHDLKNPLNGIILAMDMLADEEDLGEVRRMSEKVRTTARQMVALIARLLDVTAIESGRRNYHFQTVDIAQLVLAVADSHRLAAAAKGHRIQVACEGTGLEAWTDREVLAEVLENLVSNALKFMPKGPPEREVTLRVAPNGRGVDLSVQDQGPGFTAEDQKKAFAPFTRLSAKPTGGEQSTGLGLSIVKRFVQAMGGEIALVSEPGHGATIRITLPGCPG